MRNTNLKLTEPIPIEIRKMVYSEALIYYKNIMDCHTENKQQLKKYDSSILGICMSLPCILWDLDSYMDDVNGIYWNYFNTEIAFPEIKHYIKNLNIKQESNLFEMAKQRYDIIQKIINNLNKK